MFIVYAARGHATQECRWILEDLKVIPLGVCSTLEEAEGLREECRSMVRERHSARAAALEDLKRDLESRIGEFPEGGTAEARIAWHQAWHRAVEGGTAPGGGPLRPLPPFDPEDIGISKLENPTGVL